MSRITKFEADLVKIQGTLNQLAGLPEPVSEDGPAVPSTTNERLKKIEDSLSTFCLRLEELVKRLGTGRPATCACASTSSGHLGDLPPKNHPNRTPKTATK